MNYYSCVYMCAYVYRQRTLFYKLLHDKTYTCDREIVIGKESYDRMLQIMYAYIILVYSYSFF
jgi:hypothetical protein